LFFSLRVQVSALYSSIDWTTINQDFCVFPDVFLSLSRFFPDSVLLLRQCQQSPCDVLVTIKSHHSKWCHPGTKTPALSLLHYCPPWYASLFARCFSRQLVLLCWLPPPLRRTALGSVDSVRAEHLRRLYRVEWAVAPAAAQAILKWGPRRGPKAGESSLRRRRKGGVREWGLGGGSAPTPENFEFFDLQMVCFGILCSAKFNIWLQQNTVKITH